MIDLIELIKELPDKRKYSHTTSHKFKMDIAEYFGDRFLNKKCLEVGTAIGHTTRLLSFLFYKVYTIEILEGNIKKAQTLNKDIDNIDYLSLVATDGHRLALVTRPSPGIQLANGVILHKKALGELTKLLQTTDEEKEDVSVYITENHAIFNTKKNELSSRLIEGEFPKYQQVIPEDHQYQVSLQRNDLLSALRRVSLFSSETRLVKFTFKKGSLNLSTSGSEFGEADESVACNFTGKELTIGFNYRLWKYCWRI